MYSIFHSQRFDKELEKLPHEFKLWLDKIEDQLVEILMFEIKYKSIGFVRKREINIDFII